MNSTLRRAIVTFVAAVCGVSAEAAQAAVGARVLVQEWSPLSPDRQSVKVLADQPSIVSDSLLSAWSRARVSLCDAIAAQLGASRAAAGQTLRDIQCVLDPNAGFSLRQNGANSIVATFSLPRNSITATSTQPTACGRECDPRFSVSASALVALGISVQADSNQPLAVTSAKLAFSNASIDSHNFAADIAKWVDDNLVPFFRGASFQTLATDAINSTRFDFTGRFNSALANVNAQLRGPAQYVRVGLWARATRITVAFAPSEITPPANGSMSGVVRWDSTKVVSTSPGGPLDCAGIRLISTVQTGPAPLIDPDNYSNVGIAPTRQVGSMAASVIGATCTYTLAGIAAGWPNQISASIGGGGHGGLVKVGYALKPDGWREPVVPTPGAPDHNYLVYETFGGAANSADALRALRRPGDPVMSSIGDRAANPVTYGQPAVRPPVPVTRSLGAPVVRPLSVTPPSTLTRGAAQNSATRAVGTAPASAPQSTLGH